MHLERDAVQLQDLIHARSRFTRVRRLHLDRAMDRDPLTEPVGVHDGVPDGLRRRVDLDLNMNGAHRAAGVFPGRWLSTLAPIALPPAQGLGELPVAQRTLDRRVEGVRSQAQQLGGELGARKQVGLEAQSDSYPEPVLKIRGDKPIGDLRNLLKFRPLRSFLLRARAGALTLANLESLSH